MALATAGGLAANGQIGAAAAALAGVVVDPTQTGTPHIEAGQTQWSGAAASSGTLTITFGTAFANAPVAVASSAGTAQIVAAVTARSTTQITIAWRDTTGATWASQFFNWIAYSPAG